MSLNTKRIIIAILGLAFLGSLLLVQGAVARASEIVEAAGARACRLVAVGMRIGR